MSLYSDEYHWKSGRHSNIPDCCIKEWIEGRRVNPDDFKGWGYVPCSDCALRKNKVEVHICNPSCGNFLLNDLGLPFNQVFWNLLNNFMLGQFASPTGYKLLRTEAYALCKDTDET